MRPKPETRARKGRSIVPDIAHPTDPIAKSAIPMKSGILRQVLSLIGPQTSCAIAKPIKKPVIVSSESPCSCRSIVGIAGRYTSVDSDVHAISALRTTKKDSEVFEEFKFFRLLLFEWAQNLRDWRLEALNLLKFVLINSARL